MPRPSPPIISIGYEGRTPEELISLLVEHRVRKVVDVRELPLSRRKGFSKTPLGDRLREAGIAYRHLRAAGNPHRHLKTQRARCLALYARHLARHPDIVALVCDELGRERVAVLCFERAHADCHRSHLLAAVAHVRRPARPVIHVE